MYYHNIIYKLMSYERKEYLINLGLKNYF